jgi:dienelactone hydrolase
MNRRTFAISTMLPLVLCASVAAANQASPMTFAITPARPQMDDRLSVTVSGLPPNCLITIHAKSQAQDQLWWRSEALFNSGPKGTIDLGTQAPLSGAYNGIDAMGLIWSMRPDANSKAGDHAFFAITDWFRPVVTELEVFDSGQLLGTTSIERRFARPGTRCNPISEQGLSGFLCSSGDRLRHPGIIVLGGSEGGPGLSDAALLLASRGFTTMSLAYFGANGLPPTLQSIPIEYFGKALAWLRARPETDSRFVAVFGASRGAEAALQFAATYPEVAAVIARSPSYVRWEGATARQLPGGPAWTWQGKPLTYLPIRIPLSFAAQFVWNSVMGNPIPFTPLFLHNLENSGDTSNVEIPVENIRGPVLLLSGKDDQKWPSSLMATRLMERLRHHAHPYADQLLSYDAAGHWIPCEYLPTAGTGHGMIGGTPEGTAAALADSWPMVLNFLEQAWKEKSSAE